MWPIVGHQWAVSLLERCIALERLSHAYLFTGPPRIGKTTLALSLAQTLNCTGEDRPCGVCLSCHKISQGTHPDVRVIDLEYQKRFLGERERSKFLGIDTIRSIQSEAALRPFEGRWKVFIIPEAESMTPEAANSLLKTLEEPPPHVLLLLTTLHAGLLLPTIVSRCQIFNLRPPPMALIQEALEQRGVEGERARLLAALSAGRVGWAMEVARDENLLAERSERVEQLLSLPRAKRLERLTFAEQLARQPERIGEILTLWLGWWRDLLLVRGGSPERVENIDRRAALAQEARRYGLGEIKGFIAALRRTMRQLENNVNPRLALEVLMLELPQGEKISPERR